MAENISPEERLFKVIQQAKQPGPEEAGPVDKKPGGWLGALKRLIPSRRSAAAGPKKGFNWKRVTPSHIKLPELNPGIINRILAAALIVIVVLVAYSAVNKRQDTKKITEAVSKIPAPPISLKMKPLEEASSYLNKVKKRNIFDYALKAPDGETKQVLSATLQELSRGLKLQGIAWGDTPKAMIFSQEEGESKMYFLMKGQEIGTTGVKIVKISKDKVVIGDGKTEMDLL